jgi:glucan phosphorylase
VACAYWFLKQSLTCVVPGYKTGTCNNLRLWGSKAASGEFDFQKFNSGEYESSVADQQRAETISAVLYPNDKYVFSRYMISLADSA